MKKVLSIGAISIVCVLVVCFGVQAYTKFDFKKKGSETAQLLEKSNEEGSKILYQNDLIKVSEDELRKKVYGLESAYDANGVISEKNTKAAQSDIYAEALKKIVEQKMLVIKAEQKGYSFSEKEYEEYKETVKKALENAENKDETQAFMDGFGGIDKYFEYMKNEICDAFKVRKYLDDLKADYAEQLKTDIYDPTFTKQWEEREESIKNDAYHEAGLKQTEFNNILETCNRDASDKE